MFDITSFLLGLQKGKSNNVTLLEDVPITLDFSNSDQQNVSVPEGYAVKSAIIAKPETLIPENIAEGVTIAGVEGTHVGGGASGGSGEAVVWFVTFIGADGSELFKMPVLDKDDCKDPITHGDIETPTKESTVSQVFTYNGWALTADGTADSSALKNVTEDRTVYAAFTASPRYYTVNFYDGETLLSTKQVAYGVTPTVTTPEKSGFSFNGWQPTIGTVTADIDYYAQWLEKVTFAGGSWEDIIRIAESGQAEDYFKVGDTKLVPWGSTDYNLTVKIAGFNHDDLTDGTGKAAMTIVCETLPPLSISQSGSSNGAVNSTFFYGLVPNVYTYLPQELQAGLKYVNKVCDTSKFSGENPETQIVSYRCFPLSLAEMNWMKYPSEYPKFITTLGTPYQVYSLNNFRFHKLCSTNENADYWTRNIYRSGYRKPMYGVKTKTSGGWYTTSVTDTGTVTASVLFGFCI